VGRIYLLLTTPSTHIDIFQIVKRFRYKEVNQDKKHYKEVKK
jgi:hypothetical protein